MSDPISIMTLAALAAVGSGISAFGQQKANEAQMKSQEGIAAGQLQLGQDQLSQQDKHFRQNAELQRIKDIQNKPGQAIGILGGLGQLKKQQF